MIVTHAFLSHYDFLRAIYDEVATLVVATIFTIFHSLVLIQIFELTKLRSQHHWNLPEVNSFFILLRNDVFDFPLALASCWAIIEKVSKLLFTELNISVDLCRVGQISHPGFVGKHR